MRSSSLPAALRRRSSSSNERRVVGVHRERALDVADRRLHVAEALLDAREAAELVHERARVGVEAEARAARARGLGMLGRRLVEAHELVEHAAIDGGRGGSARRRALQQIDGPRVVAEERVGDAGCVELEPRAAPGRRLEAGFVGEERREARRVVVRGRVHREGVAGRTDARVEAERSLVGAARGVDAAEPDLEDPRALDVQPAREVRLGRERVGHAPEVRDEILPGVIIGAVREGASDEIGLEPLERRGVMRSAAERELPGLTRVVRAVSGLEEARLLGEELDGRGLARRDGNLALEVAQHRHELGARVQAPPQDGVGGGEDRDRP